MPRMLEVIRKLVALLLLRNRVKNKNRRKKQRLLPKRTRRRLKRMPRIRMIRLRLPVNRRWKLKGKSRVSRMPSQKHKLNS